MQLISGSWEGELISDDGRLETHFSLTQPWSTAVDSLAPAMSLAGNAPSSLRLLDGARNALVALADAVPDPVSGRLAQLVVEARVLGDRLVGRWLRRDLNGVVLASGRLTAVRSPLPCKAA